MPGLSADICAMWQDQARDETVFWTKVRLYIAKLCASRVPGRLHDEVVQLILEHVWLSLPKFQEADESSFTRWIAAIVRNHCTTQSLNRIETGHNVSKERTLSQIVMCDIVDGHELSTDEVIDALTDEESEAESVEALLRLDSPDIAALRLDDLRRFLIADGSSLKEIELLESLRKGLSVVKAANAVRRSASWAKRKLYKWQRLAATLKADSDDSSKSEQYDPIDLYDDDLRAIYDRAARRLNLNSGDFTMPKKKHQNPEPAQPELFPKVTLDTLEQISTAIGKIGNSIEMRLQKNRREHSLLERAKIHADMLINELALANRQRAETTSEA